MWVLVRGGKAVLQADSYNALMSVLASRRVKDTDTVRQLPIL
jgi:hypothetical protein